MFRFGLCLKALRCPPSEYRRFSDHRALQFLSTMKQANTLGTKHLPLTFTTNQEYSMGMQTAYLEHQAWIEDDMTNSICTEMTRSVQQKKGGGMLGIKQHSAPPTEIPECLHKPAATHDALIIQDCGQ